MAIQIINSSHVLPVSVELVKKHLRILDFDEDETLQNLYIPTAAQIFTSRTHRQLITATVEQVFDSFPSENYFLLERYYLQSFDKIEYLDADFTWQELDSDEYFISETMPSSVIIKSGEWPKDIHPSARGCVKVTYDAGFGDYDDSIPFDVKQALSMIVGDLYLHREDTIVYSGQTLNPSWRSTVLMDRYKINYYQHPSQERR